jgi:histidine triad (HIT) family protein
MTPDCIFCKIVAGDIPAKVIYRDEHVTAFHDLHPQAPVHLLIVPNQHYESLATLAAEDAEAVGRLLTTAHQLAQANGVAESGYRVVVNMGPDASLSVYHLHAHVIGGRRLGWPPG